MISNGQDCSLLEGDVLTRKVDAYIRDNYAYLLDLIIEICSIPSPTGNEEKKADFILDMIREITEEDTWKDEEGNVICHLKTGKDTDISLITAHIDTVFEGIDKICPVRKGDRIYAPSIWDNSVNVAGLIFCIKMFHDLKAKPKRDMLLAFTVGEEGLGNLRGIKHIMHHWQDKIHEVAALDTGYKSILNRSIGSRRYSINVQTEGGHSWGAFGKPNAIAYASRVINDLYKIDLPPHPKTTYNVGLIRGGRTVNSIAEEVEFVLDFRSTEEEHLSALEEKFFTLLEDSKEYGADIEIELLGERPCSGDVDTSSIINRIKLIRQYLGLDTRLRAGSTDANIPLSLGIPAVTFGVCNGGKSHTFDEYIELDSLETGMKHLAYFLLSS